MRGRFELQKNMAYRMPISLRNYPFTDDVRVVYDDCRMISVNQRTDMEALAPLIPKEFEITAPIVNWQYSNCRGVDFMINGEYRIFHASVPVRYCGEKETIDGIYPLIIFEDNAVPILGGREEDGMPKVLTDISLDRHYEDHWFAACSVNCETIARIDFHEEKEADTSLLKIYQDGVKMNVFGNRYIPKAGSEGYSLHDYILYPQEVYAGRIFAGTGSAEVIAPAEWYIQPYLFGALYALSGLPKYGFENAVRMEGKLRLCVADSREI